MYTGMSSILPNFLIYPFLKFFMRFNSGLSANYYICFIFFFCIPNFDEFEIWVDAWYNSLARAGFASKSRKVTKWSLKISWFFPRFMLLCNNAKKIWKDNEFKTIPQTMDNFSCCCQSNTVFGVPFFKFMPRVRMPIRTI